MPSQAGLDTGRRSAGQYAVALECGRVPVPMRQVRRQAVWPVKPRRWWIAFAYAGISFAADRSIAGAEKGSQSAIVVGMAPLERGWITLQKTPAGELKTLSTI